MQRCGSGWWRRAWSELLQRNDSCLFCTSRRTTISMTKSGRFHYASAHALRVIKMREWSPDGQPGKPNRLSLTKHHRSIAQQARAHSRAARAIAFAALLLLTSLTACAMQTTQDFDSTAWKSQRGVAFEDNTRIYMTGALKQVIHVGMRRDDVIVLLGPPDYMKESETTSTDAYYLGISPYAADTEKYIIQYQDGKVISHHSVQG